MFQISSSVIAASNLEKKKNKTDQTFPLAVQVERAGIVQSDEEKALLRDLIEAFIA